MCSDLAEESHSLPSCRETAAAGESELQNPARNWPLIGQTQTAELGDLDEADKVDSHRFAILSDSEDISTDLGKV